METRHVSLKLKQTLYELKAKWFPHTLSVCENPEGAPTSLLTPFMGASLPNVKTHDLEKQDETHVQETAVYNGQIFRPQAKVSRGSISQMYVPDVHVQGSCFQSGLNPVLKPAWFTYLKQPLCIRDGSEFMVRRSLDRWI